MKKKKIAVLLIMSLVYTAVPQTSLIPCNIITADAHGGRTDSNGGHKDNKNKSGLGYYHYHCGGNPPHLHTNGVCPYKPSAQTSQSKNSTENVSNNPPTPQTQAVPETKQEQPQINYGWQKDNTGWWYLNTDGSYPKSTWLLVEDKYYCFDENGYLYVSTYTPDGYWVDENGAYNIADNV